MANLKNVIYLTNEDYETLVTTGTVTIDGETLTYDENNLYITPNTVASPSEDGLMSAEDKTKLDSIPNDLSDKLNSMTENIQTVRAVAEGKCKTLILTLDNPWPFEPDEFGGLGGEVYRSLIDAEGNSLPLTYEAVYNYLLAGSDYEGYEGIELCCINNLFNGDSEYVDLEGYAYPWNYILSRTGEGYEAVYQIFPIRYIWEFFKTGDLLLLTNINLPDWWYAGNSKFYKLETQKIEIPSNIKDGTAEGSAHMAIQSDRTTFTGIDANGDPATYTSGANGKYSFQIGGTSLANGDRSFSSGTKTVAQKGAVAINDTTYAADFSFASGYKTVASGQYAHSEGYQTFAKANYSHAEGYQTEATGQYSHAEGINTNATGRASHATGDNTTASGEKSTAAGTWTNAGYADQFVVGRYNENNANNLFEVGTGSSATPKTGFAVTQFGYATVDNVGSGDAKNIVNVQYLTDCVTALKEHYDKSIGVVYSSVPTNLKNGAGENSVQGGVNSVASYSGDFVFGTGLRNTRESQAVFGSYNKNDDYYYNTLLVVGNGESDSSRNNAFAVFGDGHAELQAMGSTANSIATKSYVDDNGSGGTKLYKHIITTSTTTDKAVVIISENANSISGSTPAIFVSMPFISGYITPYPVAGTGAKYPILSKAGATIHYYDPTAATIVSLSVTGTITDTVTVL